MIVGGFSASPSSTIYSRTPSKILNSPFPKPPWSSSVDIPRFDPKLNLITTTRFAGASPNLSFRCNSSTGPGGSGSGDGDSRSVLDAFFVGKALAEALNERIESTVGEFLSTIGRLQAEQQKQVQDFQEEVLERAKKAKEKAAREAMEAQGLVSKSSTADESAVIVGDTKTNTPSVTDTVTPAMSPSSSSSSSPTTDTNTDANPIDKE